tara:strand:- start:154 stop:399 length:246 start_codon:yes stop_codon:yes gene_type:complete
MPRPNRSGGAIGLSIATLKGAWPSNCQPSSSANRQDVVLWLEAMMSDQFAGLILVMAAAFGFCAVKSGGGRHITIAQIRKS